MKYPITSFQEHHLGNMHNIPVMKLPQVCLYYLHVTPRMQSLRTFIFSFVCFDYKLGSFICSSLNNELQIKIPSCNQFAEQLLANEHIPFCSQSQYRNPRQSITMDWYQTNLQINGFQYYKTKRASQIIVIYQTH